METKSIATIAGAAAAGGVLAFAGLSLANAATGSGQQAPANAGPQMAAGQYGGPMRGGPGGMHGTPVTGETLQKITDAVLAQYPDATVDSAEEEGDGYEAHVTKADGTQVHVTLDTNFAITGEHTGPPMGAMGPHGKGPHGEKPLKGAKAKKVRAAAEQRIKGGTVVRVEKDSDGVYEAHVITTKGRPVIVEVNKRFKVTSVEKLPAMGGHMGAPPAPGQSGAGA